MAIKQSLVALRANGTRKLFAVEEPYEDECM